MSDMLAIGKVIKMPCMRSGVCGYANENVLVTPEALQQMSQSAMGIPVIIEHPDEKITNETIKNMPVVGRVADLHYHEAEELWYAHFVVDNEQAVELLKNGYGVSTAWYGQKWEKGGTYNNVPFNRELKEGKYEHLAIVKNPRYEMAKNPIFMNSEDRQNDQSKDKIITDKKKGSISMLGKVFRKMISREEIMQNSGETVVIEVNGKEVPLADVVEALAKKDEKPMINGTDEVDVDGEKVTINQLIEAFKNSKKKNMDDEEKKELEDKGTKKENEEEEDEDEDDKKEKKEEKKENSKTDEETKQRFDSLDSAYMNAKDLPDPFKMLSIKERVELGKARYGK